VASTKSRRKPKAPTYDHSQASHVCPRIEDFCFTHGSLFRFRAGPGSRPAKQPEWEKSAALGLTLTRGNSKTLLFTGNIQATKKLPAHEFNLGADATYGKSDDVKNAEEIVQAMTNDFIARIDALMKKKEGEIMTI